jgi:hypothetical protein
MNDDLFTKLQNDLAREVADHYERQKTGPASIPRTGLGASMQIVAEQLALGAFQRIKNGRWYAAATDPEARLALGALAVAARQSKRSLVEVIETIASIIPGWIQERPAADAGTVPELPIDRATGLRCRNPFLPLPPRKGETTPRYDHASQAMIKEQSPRLAKWLADCVANDGLPSVAMLDQLQAEKIEADHLRKIQYGDRQWQENKLRADLGATVTDRMIFEKSVTDPWLAKFHRSEAKLGAPKCGYDNLTYRMAIAKRDPEIREIHRQAGQILKAWQAQQQEKAEKAA